MKWVRVHLVPFLFMVVTAAASAQSERPRILSRLPETPAGRAAATLVHQFNTDSLPLPRWKRWKQIVGPVEVRRVEETSPQAIRAWVQGTVSRGWLGLEIRTDGPGGFSPDRAPVFWMGGGPPPESRPVQPQPVSETEAARRLAGYFEALAAADLFSGSVIVARHGRPVFQGAYGMADQTHRVPNRLETQFALASVGKVFTAVAIAHLVAGGKLSFIDSIARVLPEYTVAGSRSATVGQLLAHTAGLGRSPSDWIALREAITLKDLVRRVSVEPAFAPGSDTRYCNECFLLAGRIVEQVSGLSYEDYVRRFIFQPAGMSYTDWDPIDRPNPRRAITYSNVQSVPDSGQIYVPGPRRDASDLQGLRGTPAGGAYSTAPDLLAFVNALQSFRLVNPATTAELFAPHAEQPFGRANGYGFELMLRPIRMIGKGGNAQGTSAQIEMYPESGYSVIILSNYDMSAQIAAEGVRELVLGLTP
jgi:CubicO group peptidase (beta-lactamase class C family)